MQPVSGAASHHARAAAPKVAEPAARRMEPPAAAWLLSDYPIAAERIERTAGWFCLHFANAPKLLILNR